MPNSLIHATSPYLLQHAHNPVQWMQWGQAAFAAARARNVPLFVSVGYSTCYWCHVMERESFEHEPTANLMNEHFVCVKVDREERPDVDDLTMAATISMTGRGGWPTSVFFEPTSLRPFYCGTYFPREARFAGVPTFSQVLSGIANAWKTQRADVIAQSAQLDEAVRDQAPKLGAARKPLTKQTIASCVQSLLAIFDKQHGGFGLAPKFPQAVFLEFLLDARDVIDSDTKIAIDAALRTTLDAMSMGGIHDHLGGGFHRYSVDGQWTVPHFEKMLYDQAQLLRVYARASEVYADAWYAEVAEGIIEHMAQELLQPSGLLSSALDAESEHREGKSYVWTASEARECLLGAGFDENQTDLVLRVYGLAGQPNFSDPHHPHEDPSWVLRIAQRPDAIAKGADVAPIEFASFLARARSVLLVRRAGRTQPSTDTKAIACWNGLAIDALARASQPLHHRAALELASEAADALLSMPTIDIEVTHTPASRTISTRRARSWRNLQSDARDPSQTYVASGQGFLEDAAAIALGLLSLARASKSSTARRMRLQQAREALVEAMSFTGDAHDTNPLDGPLTLFSQRMTLHDGAMPSGYSVRIHALLDLYDLLGEDDPASHAANHAEREQLAIAVQQQLTLASAHIADHPVGCINAVRALLRVHRTMPEIARSLAQGSETSLAKPQAMLTGTDVVEVLAATEQVVLTANEPAELLLHLGIAQGFHVIAAQPTLPTDLESSSPTAAPTAAHQGLIPLRVDVFNGTGVAAYADYPQGELWPSEAIAQATKLPRVRVYQGRIELRVVLERDGAWTGNPLLHVRFQACSDRECLAPTMVELDIAIVKG